MWHDRRNLPRTMSNTISWIEYQTIQQGWMGEPPGYLHSGDVLLNDVLAVAHARVREYCVLKIKLESIPSHRWIHGLQHTVRNALSLLPLVLLNFCGYTAVSLAALIVWTRYVKNDDDLSVNMMPYTIAHILMHARTHAHTHTQARTRTHISIQ